MVMIMLQLEKVEAVSLERVVSQKNPGWLHKAQIVCGKLNWFHHSQLLSETRTHQTKALLQLVRGWKGITKLPGDLAWGSRVFINAWPNYRPQYTIASVSYRNLTKRNPIFGNPKSKALHVPSRSPT